MLQTVRTVLSIDGTKMVQLADFTWWVASEGYRLDQASNRALAGPVSFLPAVPILKPAGILELYSPGPDDPIHRKFAGVSDDPAVLAEFASEYGLPTAIQEPEAVTDMIEMRDRLRAVVHAVDKVNTSRADQRESSRRDAARVWQQAGRVKLTTELRHVSTLSCRDIERHRMSEAQVRVAASFELRARAADLFSHMMLLAAAELSGEAAWRACSQCGTLMPIKKAASGRARYRDTCSDRCRQRKHYLKQKEASHASQG
jgi:hypothetical protein